MLQDAEEEIEEFEPIEKLARLGVNTGKHPWELLIRPCSPLHQFLCTALFLSHAAWKKPCQ